MAQPERDAEGEAPELCVTLPDAQTLLLLVSVALPDAESVAKLETKSVIVNEALPEGI